GETFRLGLRGGDRVAVERLGVRPLDRGAVPGGHRAAGVGGGAGGLQGDDVAAGDGVGRVLVLDDAFGGGGRRAGGERGGEAGRQYRGGGGGEHGHSSAGVTRRCHVRGPPRGGCQRDD